MAKLRACLRCGQTFRPAPAQYYCTEECIYIDQLEVLGKIEADRRAGMRRAARDKRRSIREEMEAPIIERGLAPMGIQALSPEKISSNWGKFMSGLATAPTKRTEMVRVERTIHICENHYCNNLCPVGRRKFCSLICSRRYHQDSLPRPDTRLCANPDCGTVFKPRRQRDMCCGKNGCYNKAYGSKVDRREYKKEHYHKRMARKALRDSRAI